MTNLSRRAVLTAMAASGAVPLWAQVQNSPIPRPRPSREPVQIDVVQAAEQLIAKAGLGGIVACAVADAETGAILYDRGGEVPMAPASTAKALTTGYALDHLGPAHRFTTRLLATGPIRQGRLEGDLILAGGSDPGLSTDGLVSLLSQVQAMGVREVAGRFQVWDGALPYVEEIDPGQPDHLGYNPAVSGLNLNYNRVHFQWRRDGGSYRLSMDARTAAVVPPVRMVTMTAVGRSLPIYDVSLDRDGGREDWTVARPALGDSGARWLPVRNTGQYGGEVFRTLAAQRDLALSEPVLLTEPPVGVPVAQVQSAALNDVARDMLKYSTNLTAEVLGLSATEARTGMRPTGLLPSAAMMNDWLGGLGIPNAALVDHSGLGPASRIAPNDMVRYLVAMGADGPLWPVLKDITLRTPTNAREPFELRAKTGTLNFVSCLMGYVRRPRATPLAFAVLTGEPARRAAIAPGDEENPAGAVGWSRRSRALQYDLVRLWSKAV